METEKKIKNFGYKSLARRVFFCYLKDNMMFWIIFISICVPLIGLSEKQFGNFFSNCFLQCVVMVCNSNTFLPLIASVNSFGL